jgi:hypothetical protein
MGGLDFIGNLQIYSIILWLVPLGHVLLTGYWVYYNNRNWGLDPRLRIVTLIQTGIAWLVCVEWIVLVVVDMFGDWGLGIRVLIIGTEMAVENVAKRYMSPRNV